MSLSVSVSWPAGRKRKEEKQERADREVEERRGEQQVGVAAKASWEVAWAISKGANTRDGS